MSLIDTIYIILLSFILARSKGKLSLSLNSTFVSRSIIFDEVTISMDCLVFANLEILLINQSRFD